MNLLYSEAQNSEIDSNGTEELTAASNPHWFSGTGSELARGASNIKIQAERAIGQMDSTAADALGVNNYLTRDGKVARINEITPTPPEELPKYEKPDALNSGAAAIVLGDLFEQTPIIAGAIMNPLAGFAAGAAYGADHGFSEAADQGVTGTAARDYAVIRALEYGIGGAIPGVGGVGEKAVIKYGSRFIAGGAVNVGLMGSSQWSRAEVLEAHGYKQQADQIRQWDSQAAAAAFLMGGFFNLAGGSARERGGRPGETPPAPEAGAPPVVNGPAPAPETAPLRETTPVEDISSTPLAGYKLNRADVKAAKSDIANSQRHLDAAEAERAAILAEPLRGSGKKLAQAREAQQARLAEVEARRVESQRINDAAAERLASHEAYGRQRIEAMHADAATHTLLHDNYVTESAPGLAIDTVTDSVHVRAMDDAINAVSEGRAVDVSAHFAGDHGFLMDQHSFDAGTRERQELAGTFTQDVDRVIDAHNQQSLPEATTETATPGAISDTIAQPFDVLREQVNVLRETHPELADAYLPHIEAIQAEHTAARAEASQYDVAAACALLHGAN